MGWKRVRQWVGGYVRRRQDGREVFVIERWVGGVRFHVSTRCHTEGAAVKQLQRFEADPAAYAPAGAGGREAEVALTAELVEAYRGWQLGRGTTREYVDEQTRCLGDWAERLAGKDLRALSLHDDLKPAMAQWPRRQGQRIKAIKGLFQYLRRELGQVTHHQDATVDLRVPQARPEKDRRRKVVPAEDVQAVLKVLPQPYRDMLHLLTATAWHVSELSRFSQGGEEVTPVAPGGPIAVLVTRHKGGGLTRTRIDHQEHLEAARRLQATFGAGRRAWPKRMTLARVMRRACDAAGVPRFGLGVMRHSVLTWGYDAGADMEALKDFAQHKSAATTRRFYVDAAVPSGRIPVLRLL